MPSFTLAAGEQRDVKSAGLYLSIVEASGKFIIKGDGLGTELTGEVGRVLKLPNINNLTFENRGAVDIDIDYESANIEVSASGKGVVSVGNEPWIAGMRNAIKVDANATVENGKMAMLPASGYLPLPDLTIPAGQARKFANARVGSTNRAVIIQTITESNADISRLRIGVSNTTAVAGKGIILLGDIDSLAGYEFETETEVWLYNESTEDATVTGGEQWR
ncbi:hypothetical protein [Thalassotalea euphylliae]|uniref:Uncharacterized protein n=1 Tax=Thalassotalea euphylliae TaxID=1655234 RepID=A0A3E0U2Y1_9GAMM|nr:hypothetical protein [Thalassotalea euphylliae]REL31080.1 hypothetical protein DXX94_10335 [Thalassotalea euphylliae]